jgi:dTDP-4-dehydrorhamnose reductase
MELWGGIECTLNRVQDRYFDQLEYSGHYNRTSDIKLFSDLGLKKLRYPILWEKHQPQPETVIDWAGKETMLQCMQQHQIEPIAGLVHHGSGPAYVNIQDDSFVSGLAAYARQVAEKFPWINFYTPVNEPLTTARFCGLYGLWYPHGNNDRSFLRILYNECKATVLAMREIRKVNANAKLVQTEDLGKTHSTPLLKYQARFENHRRWLSFDLLSGKVVPSHPLYNYLINNGISSNELAFLESNSCPPDVMGFNYYPTSERYIDQNIKHYPAHTHGSNKKHRYADVEVVRVGNAQPSGPYELLKEAWERYGLPLSVTEAHLHCTREEQLRWLQSIWNTALELEKDGVDIIGVTAWALLGSYGWNKLLTRAGGDYEPGIMDVRSGHPRETILAKQLKSFSSGKPFKHPLLENLGWWERDIRMAYNKGLAETSDSVLKGKSVLIIGQSGVLVTAFAQACEHRNINYRVISEEDLGLTNGTHIIEVLQELDPWAIVNTTAYPQVNTPADSNNVLVELASYANQHQVKLMVYQNNASPDGETDRHSTGLPVTCEPSTIKREKAILATNAEALIIRTGALLSKQRKSDDTIRVLGKSKTQPSVIIDPLLNSPNKLTELVNTSLDLLIDDVAGVCHLANTGEISRDALALQVAGNDSSGSGEAHPVTVYAMDYKAIIPKHSISKIKYYTLELPLEDNLNAFSTELKSA